MESGFPTMLSEPGTSSKMGGITMAGSKMGMAQIDKEEDGIIEGKSSIRKSLLRQQHRRRPPSFPTSADPIHAHRIRPRRTPADKFSHHQTPKVAFIGFGLLFLMATFGMVNAQQQQKNDATLNGLSINETSDGLIRTILTSASAPSFGPNDDLINNASNTTKANVHSEGLLSRRKLNKSELEEEEEEEESNLENKLVANDEENDGEGGHFQLFAFNWAHVQAPFSLSLWLMLASIAKILFNLDRRLPETVPDSALLIGLGLVLGAVLNLLGVDSSLFTLPSSTFFLYLLPPIIFDAGYFMPNRQLFENLDSVLLFAFCGTIWNTLAIGFSLLSLAQLCPFSVPFTAFQILLFASLISAVDPVAVIAVFEEIHINEFLFINVFGEALLNDGVSVVLYQMFRKFIQIGEPNLTPLDYVAGISSFLVIAFGGLLIGILFAVIASLATKYTTQVRILAPVFIFVIPYMAYLTAELFGLSSILAIVACGIVMKQYVKGNLSHDACSSVKYFVKMLAQSSETVIFMFLGLSTMTHVHHWDWMFVGGTIALCLLHRIIGVIVQCAILNRFRTKKFTFSDQFVLSYGGLRGAIAFGLVVSLDDDLPVKNLFVTTCIAVIFFTVFVQGITIRPLLYWLKVEKQDIDHKERMIEKIYTRYCDYMMAGLEDIAGQKGKNSVRDGFERFNAKILKPMLMRNEQRKTFDTSSIVRAFCKITLIEAQQIVRSSIRKSKQLRQLSKKKKKGGIGGGGGGGGGGGCARVGPAHSPTSLSSTLGSSNCWTTTSTAMMIIEDGGLNNNTNGADLESRANSPIASSNDGKDGGKIEEDEEGGNVNGDGRLQIIREEAQMNSSPELEQYLTQPGNAEMLYIMFSRLLDRKMAELRMNRKGMDATTETDDEDANADKDDIQDNYFDAFGAVKRQRRRKETSEGSDFGMASLWPKNQSIRGVNGQRRVMGMEHQKRRCSTGDEQRRRMSLSPAIERQFGGNHESNNNKEESLIAARRLFLIEMPSLPNPIITNGSPNVEKGKAEWSRKEWRQNVP